MKLYRRSRISTVGEMERFVHTASWCFFLCVGGAIGIEYTHVPDRKQCDWLRARFEVPQRYTFSKEEKRMILDRLIWSDSFERFVATKWSSEKRFGLEGCESLIPGMKALIDRAVDQGIGSVSCFGVYRVCLFILTGVFVVRL